MNYNKRIKRLQKTLRRRNVDAILISQPHNRRYLSGFTAFDHDISESSGVLFLPASGKGWLLTDSRYALQAEQEVDHLNISIYKKGLLQFLKKFLAKQGIDSMGFESHYTLHSTAQSLDKLFCKLNIKLVPLTGLVEKMRCVKEPGEIDIIRKSVRLNEKVFKTIFPTIQPGTSEIDIALALEQEMRRRGAERASFDTIVATGDNGALPHAVPTPSPIVKNRSLTIDMGLVLDGYCSDMTRTFTVGKADKKYKKIHRIVRRAQLAGIKAVRAGATGQEVDRAAREVIKEAGYGMYFGHSLGHGVGLAVHEAPSISPRGTAKLKEGMIVTIEPGIYIPGWGGIRLEDMVVVTKNGCDNLNKDTTWLDL